MKDFNYNKQSLVNGSDWNGCERWVWKVSVTWPMHDNLSTFVLQGTQQCVEVSLG